MSVALNNNSFLCRWCKTQDIFFIPITYTLFEMATPNDLSIPMMENRLFRKKTEIEKEKFRLRKIVEKIQKANEERNTIQANIAFLEGQAGQLQGTIDQQVRIVFLVFD